MEDTIKNEWIYGQPPGEIWEYLTQPELLALWLMPNNFKPVLEHEFQFRTNPIPSLGLDGVMHCKVIEIVKGQKLVYTWKAGSGDGKFPLDTIVEWTLEPFGKGTKLTLVHSGFKPDNLDIFNGMTVGWDKNIQKMVKHLNDSSGI